MVPPRRNLIISPIGDTSVHASWLSDRQARTFDLFLIHYGNLPDFGRADATYYVRHKGFKPELLHYALTHHAEVFSRYTNIWWPDNDIRIDTAGVNLLFELFERHRLQLAQPAISKGDVSFEFVRQRPGVILRYTPFVEIMCPLFTLAALHRISATLPESRSGWGIDLVWPRYFQPHEVAIIDQIGVEHTGQLLRGELYQGLARLGIDPRAEMTTVVKKYGGFDPRLHHRLYRGKIKLPALRDPAAPLHPLRRLGEHLGLLRAAA